ncbi:MAG: hypothetical protein CMH22_05785 [Methylophaga sp.]|nr:hypothetical protein [Methylophaga sp.]
MNKLVKDIHSKNVEAGWWNDPETGESLLNHKFTPYVIGTKLNLITTEVSEATEGYRKDLMDDKLPQYRMVDVELVDALIRIFDLLGAVGCKNAGEIMEAKRNFNKSRPDHQVGNRVKKNGKKF